MTPNRAYPGEDTAPSYVGREVPAECEECGSLAYIPPKSFDGTRGYCSVCDSITEWEYWRDEPA